MTQEQTIKILPEEKSFSREDLTWAANNIARGIKKLRDNEIKRKYGKAENISITDIAENIHNEIIRNNLGISFLRKLREEIDLNDKNTAELYDKIMTVATLSLADRLGEEKEFGLEKHFGLNKDEIAKYFLGQHLAELTEQKVGKVIDATSKFGRPSTPEELTAKKRGEEIKTVKDRLANKWPDFMMAANAIKSYFSLDGKEAAIKKLMKEIDFYLKEINQLELKEGEDIILQQAKKNLESKKIELAENIKTLK